MKTARIYIHKNNREESRRVRIVDAMPVPVTNTSTPAPG